MSRYKVDAEQLSGTALAVQARATTISTENQGMARQLDELQASWEGAASGRFAGLVAEWQAAVAQIDRALADITAAMQAAARTYDQAESDAARMFAG